MRFLLSILVVIISLPVTAQSDWNLGKETDGIKVYTRKVPGHKLKEVKAVATIYANIKAIEAIIADFDNHSNWVDNCAVSEVVERKDNGECFYYNTYTTPWPAKDRDAITHITFGERSDEEVNINFNGDPDFLEEKEDYVRVPYSTGSWHLSRVDQNITELTYKIHVDSGGSIPKWMVNELILKSPYRTMKNLKKKVESH